MPFPIALAGAAIGQAGNMQTQGMNMVAQAGENYFNRKWTEKMYSRQYNDNIAFCKMQNEYNSPQAQMKRFQEGGLNPNLIYGQSNAAGPIQTPDLQSTTFKQPRFGGGLDPLSLINAFADLEIKQAQADNLKVQNNILLEDAALRSVQAKRAQFDLDFESELRPYSADYRRERVRQMRTQTDVSINEDIRRALLTSKNLEEAAERILTMREQRKGMPLQRQQTIAETERIRQTIEQLKKDNVLRDLDIELRKQGINPNDPMWARVLGRFLSNAFDEGGFENTTGNIWNSIFNYLMND